MARQKNKILMFLFSLIPGAGQMYMGFMKQGLSLMTIFATLCAVGIWLDIKPLLFFAPIILLYSFFDATNKNSMDAEAFKTLEDHYLWGDDWMEWSEGLKDSISRRDGKKAMGTETADSSRALRPQGSLQAGSLPEILPETLLTRSV